MQTIQARWPTLHEVRVVIRSKMSLHMLPWLFLWCSSVRVKQWGLHLAPGRGCHRGTDGEPAQRHGGGEEDQLRSFSAFCSKLIKVVRCYIFTLISLSCPSKERQGPPKIFYLITWKLVLSVLSYVTPHPLNPPPFPPLPTHTHTHTLSRGSLQQGFSRERRRVQRDSTLHPGWRTWSWADQEPAT